MRGENGFRARLSALGRRGLGRVGAFVGCRRRSASLRLVPLLAAASFPLLLPLLPAAALIHYVYFDRSDLPDLDPFIRFEPPTTGRVYDARGEVLIELAGEYRKVVSYDEVPTILRQAILAAEDKNFFVHSGVEYRALPRVIWKTAARSLTEWWNGGSGFRLLLPQGGSTLTQQLARGYFLHGLTDREADDKILIKGPAPWFLSAVLGIPAANKLLRKLVEVRMAFWIEEEMGRYYGSRERAKREIFARSASFFYMGNGRYGYAAASEYYFDKPLSTYIPEDAAKAALLAGISKSPQVYAPVPGDPNPLRRRNQILTLMVRNGYIAEELGKRCRAEPVQVAKHSPLKTHAPSAIKNVLDELRRVGETRFGFEDLIQGRISVRTTLDERVQTVVNEALESGLALYERRYPRAKGLIQGSVVVLRNADAAILAEAGGRQVYEGRQTLYSDYNRVTDSLRQPCSAWKPLVYLAAFRRGLDLDTTVPDDPIEVSLGVEGEAKWIGNYDNLFKGPIPVRQALAESRNAAAVWITREIGLDEVIRAARELGIRTPVRPDIATALGASEVRLLELADVYRAMASGALAEPHIIDRVTDSSGKVLYQSPRLVLEINSPALSLIQEGLRGVIRLPDGTAHSLAARNFPIPVMGKTGTTNDYRDALFVGSTYGPEGITVAVRVGFDDNRTMGARETGTRTAMPIFREIMLRLYGDELLGEAPRFPPTIESGIDGYLALLRAAPEAVGDEPTRVPPTSVGSPPQPSLLR